MAGAIDLCHRFGFDGGGDPAAGFLSLCVTSREVVWLFLEQLRFEFVPGFHGLQGRFAA